MRQVPRATRSFTTDLLDQDDWKVPSPHISASVMTAQLDASGCLSVPRIVLYSAFLKQSKTAVPLTLNA